MKCTKVFLTGDGKQEMAKLVCAEMASLEFAESTLCECVQCSIMSGYKCA